MSRLASLTVAFFAGWALGRSLRASQPLAKPIVASYPGFEDDVQPTDPWTVRSPNTTLTNWEWRRDDARH